MKAQENQIDASELVGCWTLSKQNESNTITTRSWETCASDASGPRIILNNYYEFKYYSAIRSKRCGSSSIIASGRIRFNKENQIIKLIDRTSQTVISWKLVKIGGVLYSSDVNHSQTGI